MKLPKFLIGLLIGTAVGLIVWYWQKSTSAEEGALAVLDRLAAAEARVRELEGKLRLADEQPTVSEQPEVLSGLSDLWGLDKGSEEARSDNINAEEPTTANPSDSGAASDDLKLINGIGPTYEGRLKEAGILTYKDLAQQTPDNLKAITGLKSLQSAAPEKWIAEAQSLSKG
jgi:predicted flap endonuclease-1-like 5' DNA nuclease